MIDVVRDTTMLAGHWHQLAADALMAWSAAQPLTQHRPQRHSGAGPSARASDVNEAQLFEVGYRTRGLRAVKIPYENA